jgi:hypothetical protein
MTKYVCDTCKREFKTTLNKMIINLNTYYQDNQLNSTIDLCDSCKELLTRKYTSYTTDTIVDIFSKYVKPKEYIVEPISDYLNSKNGTKDLEAYKTLKHT